jgi:hypothetical protein
MTTKFSPLRAFINLTALGIFAVAFYNLFSKGILPFIGYTIFALVLFTPRIIYSKIKGQNLIHPELLSRMEILVTTGIILNALGYMWLFAKGPSYFIEYDTVVHFVAPVLFTIVIAMVYGVYYNFKKVEIDKSKFILKLAVITIAYTLLWEVVEYVLDIFFHLGIYGQEGQALDTFYDVTADFLSIPVSSVIIYKYFDYFIPRFEKITNFVKEHKGDLKKIKEKIKK